MTSSQLNYQLKHIFGGIHIQNDLSLEQLENQQKKILKLREKAQLSHKKIYQSLNIIKSSILDLTDNFLTLTRGTKLSGNVVAVLSSEINSLLQNLSQQSLSLSKTMQNKGESYEPNLKKIREKYQESAQNLEHYKKKVNLLKNNMEKQSLIKIKPDEYQRVQRNYQKLLNAEKDYEKIQQMMIRRIIEFNNEGIKNIYNDFISVFSSFGSNVMIMNQKVTKYLYQSLIFRQLSSPKKINSKEIGNNMEKETNSGNNHQFLANGQNYNQYQQFVSNIIKQKQIQNYFKSIICMELTKSQKTQKVQQIFHRKQTIYKFNDEQKNKTVYFNQFKNIFCNYPYLQKNEIKNTLNTNKESQIFNTYVEQSKIQEQKQMSEESMKNELIEKDTFSTSTQFENKQQLISSASITNIDSLQKFNQIWKRNSPNTIKENSPKSKKKLKFIQNKAVIESDSQRSQGSSNLQQQQKDYFLKNKTKKSEQDLHSIQVNIIQSQNQSNFDIITKLKKSETQKQNLSKNLFNSKINMNEIAANPSLSQKLLKYCHPSLLQQNQFQSGSTKNVSKI